MSCKICGDYIDANKKCYSKFCENSRFRREVKTRKPLKPCQVCDEPGCQKPAVDAHEITAGASRQNTMQNVRAMAWLCRKHHDEWQGIGYSQQIARVVLSTIDAVNVCCGNEKVTTRKIIYLLEDSLDTIPPSH